MSDVNSDLSYYRLYCPKSSFYYPKVTFDVNPLKAESLTQKIYEKIEKPKFKVNPSEVIRHSDIQTMWKTGNYDVEGSPFKINRLSTLDQISKYYFPQHSVRYDIDVPFFMPTDKLYLNNSQKAVKEQWDIFTRKTGISRQQQKKIKFS